MKLRDTATQVNCPTSRFLTKEELKEGSNSTHPSRMNFIFRHGVPLSVRDDHAKVLMGKYPTVVPFAQSKVEKKVKEDPEEEKVLNGLGEKTYKELQNIGREKGFSMKEVMVKKDVLIKMLKGK